MPVGDAMERGPPQLLSLVAAGLAIVRIVKFLTIRDDDADAQAGAAAGCWLAAGLLLLVLVFRRRNTQPSPASQLRVLAGSSQPNQAAGQAWPTRPRSAQTHSWRAHAFTRLSMRQHSKQQCARGAPLRLNRVPSQSRRLDSFQIRNSSERFSSSGIFLFAARKIGR